MAAEAGGYTVISRPYVYQLNKHTERYLRMVAAIADDRTGEVGAHH